MTGVVRAWLEVFVHYVCVFACAMKHTKINYLTNITRSMEIASTADRLCLEVNAQWLRGDFESADEQLVTGMSVGEVRSLLKGWSELSSSAGLSPDKTHLYYTVEFMPPADQPQVPLRVKFDNGKLMAWDHPTDAPTRRVRRAPG
jgi:hypothetical protein